MHKVNVIKEILDCKSASISDEFRITNLISNIGYKVEVISVSSSIVLGISDFRYSIPIDKMRLDQVHMFNEKSKYEIQVENVDAHDGIISYNVTVK